MLRPHTETCVLPIRAEFVHDERMARLFVAIDLPDDDKVALANLEGVIPRARWVEEDGMHVTLRFLGDVEGARVETVIGALSGVAAATPGFSMAVRGMGHFPPHQSPRVLWAGIDADSGLGVLQHRVEHACQRAGLEPERRKFAAHVTLVRLRPDPGNEAAAAEFLTRHALLARPRFDVRQFLLFSSVLGRQGAEYRTEAAFPLRGGDS